jgi:membrane-bound serine protease (ClpP class)
VPDSGFALKGKAPLPHTILTSVKRLALLVVLAAAVAAPAAHAAPRVLAIHFKDDVNPVTQDWLNGQLDRAVDDHYDAAVIVIDTPGGLDESMRKIVAKELSVHVPVVVWVGPSGARAASAGVWISEAADVLAMAPETNIGSSTPISGGGQDLQKDLRRKVVNDAAASLRGLARTHGRNAKWADAAVRRASNLTADEALRMNVIDLMAPDLPTLLDRIDGRKTVPRGYVLHTADATVTDAEPGFVTRFLSTLINPNLLSLLFLAGIAGIGYEIFHPGVVLPGALGAVALLTALFGFSILPLSWAGLGLVLLGIGLLVLEAHVVSHGTLAVAGLISLGVGLATLFHNAPAPYETSIPLVFGVTIALGGFWVFALTKAVQVRRRPVSVGPEEIVGMEGIVRNGGLVFVRGELWRAQSEQPLAPGQHVRVDGVDGLTLSVHGL